MTIFQKALIVIAILAAAWLLYELLAPTAWCRQIIRNGNFRRVYFLRLCLDSFLEDHHSEFISHFFRLKKGKPQGLVNILMFTALAKKRGANVVMIEFSLKDMLEQALAQCSLVEAVVIYEHFVGAGLIDEWNRPDYKGWEGLVERARTRYGERLTEEEWKRFRPHLPMLQKASHMQWVKLLENLVACGHYDMVADVFGDKPIPRDVLEKLAHALKERVHSPNDRAKTLVALEQWDELWKLADEARDAKNADYEAVYLRALHGAAQLRIIPLGAGASTD